MIAGHNFVKFDFHRDCSCWPARLPVPPSNPNLPNNTLNSPSSARQYHLNSDVFIEEPVREWIQAQRSHEQKLSASFTDMHLEKVSLSSLSVYCE